jgi:hypothetical protein
MNSFKTNFDKLFSELKNLETEIQNNLKSLNYE